MACLLPRTPRIHVRLRATLVSSHDRLSLPRTPEYCPSAFGLDERRYPYATHLPHDTNVRRLPSRSQAVATTSPTVSHRGSAALYRLSHQETPRKARQWVRHGGCKQYVSWGFMALALRSWVEVPLPRSEERRVGKECRYRWWRED